MSVVDVDVGRVRVVIKSWERKEKNCACSLFYVTIVRFTVIDDHALFFFPSFLVHSRFIARHKTQNV